MWANRANTKPHRGREREGQMRARSKRANGNSTSPESMCHSAVAVRCVCGQLCPGFVGQPKVASLMRVISLSLLGQCSPGSSGREHVCKTQKHVRPSSRRQCVSLPLRRPIYMQIAQTPLVAVIKYERLLAVQ